VDIFSLGVVVFEMWHPFSTAMERVVLLRELREAGKMPPGWEAAHPQVARLIRCVLTCGVARVVGVSLSTCIVLHPESGRCQPEERQHSHRWV
jgi:hypothetical protein